MKKSELRERIEALEARNKDLLRDAKSSLREADMARADHISMKRRFDRVQEFRTNEAEEMRVLRSKPAKTTFEQKIWEKKVEAQKARILGLETDQQGNLETISRQRQELWQANNSHGTSKTLTADERRWKDKCEKIGHGEKQAWVRVNELGVEIERLQKAGVGKDSLKRALTQGLAVSLSDHNAACTKIRADRTWVVPSDADLACRRLMTVDQHLKDMREAGMKRAEPTKICYACDAVEKKNVWGQPMISHLKTCSAIIARNEAISLKAKLKKLERETVSECKRCMEETKERCDSCPKQAVERRNVELMDEVAGLKEIVEKICGKVSAEKDVVQRVTKNYLDEQQRANVNEKALAKADQEIESWEHEGEGMVKILNANNARIKELEHKLVTAGRDLRLQQKPEIKLDPVILGVGLLSMATSAIMAWPYVSAWLF